MAEETSAPEKTPGCIGFVFYSLGAAIPAVIILVAVSMFAMGGEEASPASNLRVNIGGTILCVVAAVLVFNAFRARRSGRELKGGEALVLYGSPGLALALLVPTIAGWSAHFTDAQNVAESGTQTITLTGEVNGDYYALSETATIITNAEYQESRLEMYASRLQGQKSSNTPVLTVTVGNLKCESRRGYLWSTSAGSNLSLTCDRFVPLDELATMNTGHVSKKYG